MQAPVIHIIMNNFDSSIAKLWQLISPTLPVGAYSYSQGLEYAVEHGWVNSEENALDWIGGQLLHAQATLDVAVLKRSYAACQKKHFEEYSYWNSFLLAARETSELLYEDLQMGSALMRLLESLNIQLPKEWLTLPDRVSFLAIFSLAVSSWEIDVKQSAAGYLWSWCENQVMAAVKLIPLGQT